MAGGPALQPHRYCVEFAKDGPARFLSHLDLQAGLERTLRRARLPLAFSRGFHPRPRLQFEDALPLGWSSDRERLWVDLTTSYPSSEALRRLRAAAPAGVEFLRAFPWTGKVVPETCRRFRVERADFPADLAERLAERFPREEGGRRSVEVERAERGWLFELRASGSKPAPSLKKVLKLLLGEDLPGSLRVRRLAPPEEAAT